MRSLEVVDQPLLVNEPARFGIVVVVVVAVDAGVFVVARIPVPLDRCHALAGGVRVKERNETKARRGRAGGDLSDECHVQSAGSSDAPPVNVSCVFLA